MKNIAITAIFTSALMAFGPQTALAQVPEASAATAAPLSGARLVGQGVLRFLGFEIYRARLWVQPGFDADNYGAQPLALELTYHRDFTAEAIAKPVFPGLESLFLGTVVRNGVFEERCQTCGDCVLGETAGICPVTWSLDIGRWLLGIEYAIFLPLSQYHRRACRRISYLPAGKYDFFQAKCSRNAVALACFPFSRSQ